MSHHTRSINFVTRSRRWLAPASLVLSAVLLTACYSQAASDQAMPAPSVSIMSVAAQPIQPWEGFTGRVAAVDSVELRARVSNCSVGACAPSAPSSAVMVSCVSCGNWTSSAASTPSARP